MDKEDYGMSDNVNIKGISDEELIRRFSVEINGKKFMRADVLEAMGKRSAEKTTRKPGDPGTIENPIFKNGHAYVYSSMNRLIMWEDYPEEIPEGKDLTFDSDSEYVYNSRGKLVRLERIDPTTMDEFILTPETKLTEEQIRQLADSESRPIGADEDCPEATQEQLERFRKFGQERNKRRAAMERAKLGIK